MLDPRRNSVGTSDLDSPISFAVTESAQVYYLPRLKAFLCGIHLPYKK